MRPNHADPADPADPADQRNGRLARRLGLTDAVFVGLSAMIGSGVFVAFAPAAAAAGSALLFGLAIAGLIAYCNATSSARLAALYPESGGTYVYGTRRLGGLWGYLAGVGFVVGKTASCAAMAYTVGAYVAPDYARWVGLAAVIGLTALNCRGIQKSASLARIIVVLVVAVLAFVVVVAFVAGEPEASRLNPFTDRDLYGVLQAAGLLFFAFAGYARIVTLGEEVTEPGRTIPRAVPLALGVVLVIYIAVAAAALATLGASRLAGSEAPLVDVVASEGGAASSGLALVVRVGAALAALGALLSLILGVSRTILAMARDGHLPRVFAAVHPRFGVPHRAELAIGLVVALVVLLGDLRGMIGFSSFGVLAYYGIANASALTLRAGENPPARWVPLVGVGGCAVLAFALPITSVMAGAGVFVVAATAWSLRRFGRRRSSSWFRASG